jgi:hypothetical protein
VENWGVYIAYTDSGQKTLVRDGFFSYEEAKNFEKTLKYDELDEFTIIKEVSTKG